MDFKMLLIGFLLAAVMGAGIAALLAALRPSWPQSRRLVIAASFLPLVTVIATVAMMLVIRSARPASGGDMHDLALRAVATYGAMFTAWAFVGGFAGALLARSRRHR